MQYFIALAFHAMVTFNVRYIILRRCIINGCKTWGLKNSMGLCFVCFVLWIFLLLAWKYLYLCFKYKQYYSIIYFTMGCLHYSPKYSDMLENIILQYFFSVLRATEPNTYNEITSSFLLNKVYQNI